MGLVEACRELMSQEIRGTCIVLFSGAPHHGVTHKIDRSSTIMPAQQLSYIPNNPTPSYIVSFAPQALVATLLVHMYVRQVLFFLGVRHVCSLTKT